MKKLISLLIANAVTMGLLTVPVAQAAFKDSGWGVRPLGMGGAFTAVADDSNAPLYNPAGVSSVDTMEASFMSSKLFTGLEGVDLGLNYFSYIYPVSPSVGNFGVSWASTYSTGLYREDAGSISYGRVLNDLLPLTDEVTLSAGANLKYLRHEYELDMRSSIDPVFSGGRTADAVTGDIGLLAQWTRMGLAMGIASKNITTPDVGLKTTDTVENENVVGFSYYNEALPYVRLPLFTFALDLVSRGKDFDFRAGAETWLLNGDFAVRVGGNSQEVAMGLGYEFDIRQNVVLVVDYALAWPLEVEKTSGSHRMGVTLRLP